MTKNDYCGIIWIVGGVQGAVEGYRETGTLEGTLRSMGKGAAKGALEGAKDGLISGMVMGGLSGAISCWQGNPSFCFVAGTTVRMSKRQGEYAAVKRFRLHAFPSLYTRACFPHR